uniref:Uncharacterized protein n=1 Tax=Chaetoceros debilis TaxID=122233 RepID=A0A7S3Q184_9STRA
MYYEQGQLPVSDGGAGARGNYYRPHPQAHPHERIETRQKDNVRERPIPKRRVGLKNNDGLKIVKTKARKRDEGGKFNTIQVKASKGSTSPGRTREVARQEYLYGANNMGIDSRDDAQFLRRRPRHINPLHQRSREYEYPSHNAQANRQNGYNAYDHPEASGIVMNDSNQSRERREIPNRRNDILQDENTLSYNEDHRAPTRWKPRRTRPRDRSPSHEVDNDEQEERNIPRGRTNIYTYKDPSMAREDRSLYHDDNGNYIEEEYISGQEESNVAREEIKKGSEPFAKAKRLPQHLEEQSDKEEDDSSIEEDDHHRVSPRRRRRSRGENHTNPREGRSESRGRRYHDRSRNPRRRRGTSRSRGRSGSPMRRSDSRSHYDDSYSYSDKYCGGKRGHSRRRHGGRRQITPYDAIEVGFDDKPWFEHVNDKFEESCPGINCNSYDDDSDSEIYVGRGARGGRTTIQRPPTCWEQTNVPLVLGCGTMFAFAFL